MKKHSLKLFLCACFSAFVDQTAIAQNRLETNELAELTLYENKSNWAIIKKAKPITIITKEDIKNTAAQSLNDLLANVLGIQVTQRAPFGGQADITMDGGSFEQVMILWNGMKLMDPQTAHHQMNIPIPISMINRIEIINGPTANLYGLNALSGAINIITDTSMEKTSEILLKMGTSAITKDEKDGKGWYTGKSIEWNANFQTGKTNHSTAIKYLSTNGQRRNTEIEQWMALVQGNLPLSQRTKIDWHWAWITNDFGANGFYAPPYDENAQEKVNTMMANIMTETNWNEKWKLTTKWNARWNKDDYRLYEYDLSKSRSLHQNQTYTFDANLSYNSNWGKWALRNEWRTEKVSSNNLGVHDRQWIDMTLNYAHHWKNKIFWHWGTDIQYNNQYGWKVFPGIDITWRANNHSKWYTSWGTGVRIPSFTDLYLNQKPGNIGNPDLQPERAQQWELKWEYQKKYHTIYARTFWRSTDDLIDWIKWENASPFQTQNKGNNTVRGLSLQYQIKFPLAHDHHFWLIKWGYQWMDLKEKTAFEGAYSKYRLNHNQHQWINNIQYVNNNWVISLEQNYFKKVNHTLKGILNAKVVWKQKKINYVLEMHNLNNEKEHDSNRLSIPSRWMNVGLSYQW